MTAEEARRLTDKKNNFNELDFVYEIIDSDIENAINNGEYTCSRRFDGADTTKLNVLNRQNELINKHYIDLGYCVDVNVDFDKTKNEKASVTFTLTW